MIGLVVPIILLAIAIAAVRVVGVMIVRNKVPPQRTYTRPIRSGVHESSQSTSREPNA